MQGMWATRVARRDATLYQGSAAGRSDRLDPSGSVSYSDVGCGILWGFPLGVDMQGMWATRFARRDATLYQGSAAGRSSRLDPSGSVSYSDAGRGILWGFPLGVDMQGVWATRFARRDATLYLHFIHYFKFTILNSKTVACFCAR